MQQPKTITLFGGAGFIGRHTVMALARTGATLKIATRNPRAATFLKTAGAAGQIVPIHCDIHDDASVAAALEGSQQAINFLGILYEKGRKSTFQKIHIDAAERIARACASANLETLVHISSMGAAADAKSMYARSKAEGEKRVRAAFGKTVILRPSIVFGPEDSFFNRFSRMASFSPALPVVGGGATKFQPVYVGDIARAITHILTLDNPEKLFGMSFDLGGPKTYSFFDLLTYTLETTGKTNRMLLELPFPVAKLIGFFAQILPVPPLTVDQVRSLEQDNIAPSGSCGLSDLGIAPTALEAIVPAYLSGKNAGKTGT